ncbi:MAG: rRNA (guanine527-N7)-methyltransferase [Thermoanaerobaculia bacterium]|jgi:16S rRNA (guanine527-N7)-methyltransferase|nr:rRNA (guanine527-N7)-methyltransferase [Thermoanaerobaculia bacterium]
MPSGNHDPNVLRSDETNADRRDAIIDAYKRELLRWNERINLIGPEAAENLDDHVAEAVAAAEILRPRGNVLDFGSGGGLPAIPMAIMSPNARVHMVEVDRKKWAFLKHIVRACELNAVVYGDRLARAVTRFPPALRFSLVTSRAVGNPQDWVPLLREWLEPGARIALFQGSQDVPVIPGFEKTDAVSLPRGTSNYLVTLTFHVEQIP